jgi:Protein of unknown function (DUF5661)
VAGDGFPASRSVSAPITARLGEERILGRSLRPWGEGVREEENQMAARTGFSAEEARSIGAEIGIDWSSAPFDVEQFRMGMDVELEHGLHDSATNVTDSDPVVTGKIALAHLKEFSDYYTRLARMEDEAKRDSQR